MIIIIMIITWCKKLLMARICQPTAGITSICPQTELNRDNLNLLDLILLVPKANLDFLLKSVVECPGFALAVECKTPRLLKQNTQLRKACA
jgi:hypothetical protein